MALLATPNFTSATLVDAPGWTTQNGTMKAQNGSGFLTPPAGAGYSPVTSEYTGLASRADKDTYLEFTVPTGEFYFALSHRTPSPPTGYFPNGYSINVNGADSSYQFNWTPVNGNPVNLGYGNFSPTPGVVWGFRLRTVGTTVQAKVWPITGEFAKTEPGQWDFTVDNNATPGAGFVALSLVQGPTTNITVPVRNMKIYDELGVAAVPPPGGFAGLMPWFGRKMQSTLRRSLDIPSQDPLYSNGRYFDPIKVEDFDRTAGVGFFRTVYSDMGYYNGNLDTSNNGRYDPDSTLSAHDSMLDVHMFTGVPSAGAQAGGAPPVASPLIACIMPDAYTPITYGRAAICYKVASFNGLGYKFVPLLWPSSNDWNDGEIDFVEFDIGPGRNRTRPANAKPNTLGQGQNGNPIFEPLGVTMNAPDDALDFHVAEVEFTPEGMRFYHDGLLITELGPSATPTTPMRMTIQCETWINQGPTPPETDVRLLIPWVATWQMRG